MILYKIYACAKVLSLLQWSEMSSFSFTPNYNFFLKKHFFDNDVNTFFEFDEGTWLLPTDQRVSTFGHEMKWNWNEMNKKEGNGKKWKKFNKINRKWKKK